MGSRSAGILFLSSLHAPSIISVLRSCWYQISTIITLQYRRTERKRRLIFVHYSAPYIWKKNNPMCTRATKRIAFSVIFSSHFNATMLLSYPCSKHCVRCNFCGFAAVNLEDKRMPLLFIRYRRAPLFTGSSSPSPEWSLGFLKVEGEKCAYEKERNQRSRQRKHETAEKRLSYCLVASTFQTNLSWLALLTAYLAITLWIKLHPFLQ